MRVMRFIGVAAIVMMISAPAIAQESPAQSVPAIRQVPIANTPSNSGGDMFVRYCAVCHGKDGKGNGPAATAMKTPPADLTILAKGNGGKYPASHVAAVIRGQAALASHGTQDMPIWGPLFSSISQGHEAQVQQRISNLVGYIDSLQAK
jgi:mono/diheme cytochrome c family protein